MMESLPVEMRRMIMDHLSNAELLTISLVNKLFKIEARTLLASRANLTAKVGCQNALSFLNELDMELTWRIGQKWRYFSGMKIWWNQRHHRHVCPKPDFIAGSLLLSLDPLKCLSLEFKGGQHLPMKCSVARVLKYILQISSRELEELELTDHVGLMDFIQDVIQDIRFPKLKRIKLIRTPGRRKTGKFLQSFLEFRRCKRHFIRKIQARAHNLEEFEEEDEN